MGIVFLVVVVLFRWGTATGTFAARLSPDTSYGFIP